MRSLTSADFSRRLFEESRPVQEACPAYTVTPEGRKLDGTSAAIISNGVLKLGVNEHGELVGKFNVLGPLSLVHSPSLTFDCHSFTKLVGLVCSF
jgi:hypothetical protein